MKLRKDQIMRVVLYTTAFITLSFVMATAQQQNVSLRNETGAENATKATDITILPVPEPEVKLTAEELWNMPITLDLRNIDIFDALKFLASKGNLNIITSKNVAGRVTLTLENVPLKDVFDLMLRANSLAYAKIGEIYSIMSEAEYKTLYGKSFSDTRQVKVRRLKYAIPEKAFNLLDLLKSDIGRVLVDQESGNVLIMDTPEKIAEMEKALDLFEETNTIEVIALKYAKAKDIEELLKTQLDSKKVGLIKADERNNQLLIQTFPQRMDEIKRLIASLDKPTKQILVDTKIVKIKLSDNLDQGFEWEGIFNIATGLGTSYVGSYPFSVVSPSTTVTSFQTRDSFYNTAPVGNATGTGGSIGAYPFSGNTASTNASTKSVLGQNMHVGVINGKRDLDVIINYLTTLGKTQVLSNPKLVVVNNQEAKIHVGERQAYVTSTTTAGTGGAPNTISEEVTFVDVGIQLAISAVINDDGMITMKVKPEISSVSSILITPTGNKIPIIDTSLAETTVMVKDGTTVLIAGLRKQERLANSSQLPVVGKIPFLGAAFKSGSDKTERVELLVILTPHIISGNDFTLGNDRPIKNAPGKEYQEYESLTPDKTMLPGTVPVTPNPAPIQPKSYRNYIGFNDQSDNEESLKGTRHEYN